MKKLLIMDEKNYGNLQKEIRRTAVRAIVIKNHKLLMIQSKYGEIKFPGGGKHKGESDIDTLVRETKEETGYDVIVKSVKQFGEIDEDVQALVMMLKMMNGNKKPISANKIIEEALKEYLNKPQNAALITNYKNIVNRG